MTTRVITGWVIAAAIATLIVYDVVMIVNKTDGDTISEILLKVASRWPVIAFAAGVVVGHLWWPQSPVE